MKVISAPPRLRVATAMMALWIPLAALETVIVSRSPWWNLPHHNIRIWSLAVGLITLPLAAWMLAGKRWALKLTALFGLVWCGLSGWVAFRTKNPALGFFTLFLATLWTALYLWLKHEMSRSFFDPHLAWYQSRPTWIPALECELVAAEGNPVPMRASRLDEHGSFVFTSNEQVVSSLRTLNEVLFRFRGREVRCRAKLVSVLKDNKGFGLQFVNESPDAQKELGDFIETMRGEGYVE